MRLGVTNFTKLNPKFLTNKLMMISILSIEVSTAGIWVSIVSMVGISKVMSVSIVSIGSISSGLGISRPLAIVVSMVGIWVSIVSMVSIAISVVCKSVSVSIESISISLGFSSSGGLGISGPLAIVVSIVVGIWVSIVSMVDIAKGMSISIVTIVIASISRCFSLASNGGKHAQGNNSNGFHHFDCLQAR